jgi:predicted kinase
MASITENSPFHREESVQVHTCMVLKEYMKLVDKAYPRYHQPTDASIHRDILGMLAVMFHDVGKPVSEIHKHSVERGDYTAYTGHELASARLFVDYISNHWGLFSTAFDMTLDDIYVVAWMIQTHLPYNIKKKDKLRAIAKTLSYYRIEDIFFDVLRADNRGRDSDIDVLRVDQVDDWIDQMTAMVALEELNDQVDDWIDQKTAIDKEPSTTKELILLIGASASGKTTYKDKLEGDIFSFDDLRHKWYGDDYNHAWLLSTQDKLFPKNAFAEFVKLKSDTIIVDNTNLTKKSRAKYIQHARQRGYYITGVLFPCTLHTNLIRQISRDDKTVNDSAVRDQYMRTSFPSLGEVDRIIVHGGNLPKSRS